MCVQGKQTLWNQREQPFCSGEGERVRPEEVVAAPGLQAHRCAFGSLRSQRDKCLSMVKITAFNCGKAKVQPIYAKHCPCMEGVSGFVCGQELYSFLSLLF